MVDPPCFLLCRVGDKSHGSSGCDLRGPNYEEPNLIYLLLLQQSYGLIVVSKVPVVLEPLVDKTGPAAVDSIHPSATDLSQSCGDTDGVQPGTQHCCVLFIIAVGQGSIASC